MSQNLSSAAVVIGALRVNQCIVFHKKANKLVIDFFVRNKWSFNIGEE